MPSYSYSNLKGEVNGNIFGKIGVLVDPRVTINRAVRSVFGEIDLRSSKRRASLTPNLFENDFDYNKPADLKGLGLIDIIPQVNRRSSQGYDLVPEEEFDRLKISRTGIVCVSDRDFIGRLRISATVANAKQLVVDELDSTTGWSGFGDGTNITADSDNFVHGSASLNWDIDASGGTTAGIQRSTVNIFDMTNYVASGSAFVWAYITSITGLTNFKLRLGNNSSNYYEQTVTANNEGNAFETGWNLLRFPLQTATQTGTVTLTTCAYAVIYMTKTAGKVSETDYRFDYLVLRTGEYDSVLYYSKYGWQTSGGTYLENSTADSDLLNCDTDEYNLIVEKASQLAALEVREKDAAVQHQTEFDILSAKYIQRYPSEAKLLTTTYHDFASLDGSDDLNNNLD